MFKDGEYGNRQDLPDLHENAIYFASAQIWPILERYTQTYPEISG